MEPPSADGKTHYRHPPQQQFGNVQPQSPYYHPPAAPSSVPQQSFQPYQPPYYTPPGGNYDPYFANIVASEPMMNMAKAYGEQFAEQSKQKLEKVVSLGRLKHYFDVDNSYVGKKIAKILFPFVYTNWTVIGSGDEPPKPRQDVNANDLYIPLMAIVTYILVVGWILGTQERFSTEQLGLISSSLMAWLFAENFLVILTKYIISISHALTVWDVLSYTGYKYVGMIIVVLAYQLGGLFSYYCALGYTALAAVFFLIRSVKSYVLDASSYETGRKRKLYLVLFISLTQPFVMWWLTRTVTNYYPIPFEEFDRHVEVKA